MINTNTRDSRYCTDKGTGKGGAASVFAEALSVTIKVQS